MLRGNGGEVGLNVLRRAHGYKLFKVFAAHAVLTGAAHDDYGTLPTADLCRGHRLGGLIKVLIQRIPSVGSDDDIASFRWTLGLTANEVHAGVMGFFQVSGESGNNVFLFSEGQIQDELHLGPTGRGGHVQMDGILLQHASFGKGTGNGLEGMVFLDGSLRTNAGQNALSSARETGEEMGFDKAFRN